MRIEIRSIFVRFSNSAFDAKLEISDVLIESTTPDWKPAILPHCRIKNESEGTVIIYKKATWSSIKLEGSGKEMDQKVSSNLPSQLRLVSSQTEIRVAIKRQISNCKLLCTRISTSLGDLVWVVTQKQLKDLSKLVQSLTEAAVSYSHYERTRLRGSRESIESFDSSSPTQEEGKKIPQHPRASKTPKKDGNNLVTINRILEYQIGARNLPSYEVIQDSFHLKTGNLDMQLCDENTSLLLQLKKLGIDIYFNQGAGSGRRHWNKANIRLQENAEWSSALVNHADKFQELKLNSVNIYHLRERGVVVRCSDFFIKSVTGTSSSNDRLPILSCDKNTFNLPDDVDNPAFQCGITMYYYPAEFGNKFLSKILVMRVCVFKLFFFIF